MAYCKGCGGAEVDVDAREDSNGDEMHTRTWVVVTCRVCGGDELFADEAMEVPYEHGPPEPLDDYD